MPPTATSRRPRRPASAGAGPAVEFRLREDAASGGDEANSAIRRAFRVLEALVEAGAPVQLADLAAATGLPKPSIHRMLSQLESVGAIKRDLEGKRLMVGAGLTRLAVAALRASGRNPPIGELMRRLVDRIGESCNLGVLDGREVLYLERVESDFPLRLHLAAGSRVPPHCTATGKLFLAEMPQAKRRAFIEALPLTAYTQHTLTDPDALEADLARVRETGVAVNSEEYVDGLIGLGIPVRDRRGALAAGLAIHAPVFRMNVAQAMAHLPLLRTTAAEIASAFGLET